MMTPCSTSYQHFQIQSFIRPDHLSKDLITTFSFSGQSARSQCHRLTTDQIWGDLKIEAVPSDCCTMISSLIALLWSAALSSREKTLTQTMMSTQTRWSRSSPARNFDERPDQDEVGLRYDRQPVAQNTVIHIRPYLRQLLPRTKILSWIFVRNWDNC